MWGVRVCGVWLGKLHMCLGYLFVVVFASRSRSLQKLASAPFPTRSSFSYHTECNMVQL